MRKPPAFQCYASDTLASEDFRIATLAERGLVMTMILQCWVSDSVPRNPREMARVLGLDLGEVTQHLTPRALRFFEEQDGRLVRPELVEQLANLLSRREGQSAGGKEGASRRWGKEKGRIGNLMCTPSANPMGSREKSGVEQKGVESNRDTTTEDPSEEEIEEYESAFAKVR